jgi:hypothetical protein
METLLAFALGAAAGWVVRGRREPPPLPSATEMVHRAQAGEQDVIAFIQLVEKKASAGDEEAIGYLLDLEAALDRFLRTGRGSAAAMTVAPATTEAPMVPEAA